MVPPCFSTMPRVTQRPRPVPTESLVVKKGEKRRSRTAGGDAGAFVADEDGDAGDAVDGAVAAADA